ncbi:MAG: DUF4272 domain-containing protein [Fimbriimonadaceae bacterium]|nr:DUF4272 domain-containing protein [Fimbriimonadaceae bacterium]
MRALRYAGLNMEPANIRRKTASIRLLKSRKIPTIEHLPPLDPDEELGTRSVEAVFRRMRANFVYFMRGQFAMEGAPLKEFRERLDKLHSWDDLSLAENKVVGATKLTQKQIVETSWALEAVYTLQWALRLESELPWPSSTCNMEAAFRTIKQNQSAESLSERPLDELLEQMDLHYRMLWACRQSMLEGIDSPGELNGSVVVERMRAFGWLVNPGISWDEVDLSS